MTAGRPNAGAISAPQEGSPTSQSGADPRRSRWVLAAVVVFTVIGVIALVNSNENAIGQYGLIEALPILYFIAVAVVVGCLFGALRFRDQPTALMAVGTVCLVVLVYGSAALVEPIARFPTAWLHAGFVESIMSIGHTTPLYDARFSWPGFFSGAGALTELSGFSSPTVWLRFAPVVLVICYIPPLLAIGRAVLPGWRAPWIGVVVFMLTDWVGQDYFSPQTIAFISYLVVMAIVLTYFRACEPGPISRWLQPRAAKMPRGFGWLCSMVIDGRREIEPPEIRVGVKVRLGLLGVIAVITFALVSSHQLTPIMLTAALLALAILGRLRPWPLFAFVGVAAMAWISYGAVTFWSSHLTDIFGGLGKVGKSVDSGVGARVVGSIAHQNVVDLRIYFAMFVWGLAALGAIRLWWSGRRVSVPLLVLAGAPIVMVAGGSYGGEGLLRVFLFSLPGSALLIAGLILPVPKLTRWITIVLAIVVALASFPAYLVARWGNETFEHFTAADRQLWEAFYSIAPLGSTVIALGPDGPDKYEDLTLYDYGDGSLLLDHYPFANTQALLKVIPNNPRGTYVVLDRSAVAYAVENLGAPPDLGNQIAQQLLATNKFTVVYQNESGIILKMNPTPTPATPGPNADLPAAPSAFSPIGGSPHVRTIQWRHGGAQ